MAKKQYKNDKGEEVEIDDVDTNGADEGDDTQTKADGSKKVKNNEPLVKVVNRGDQKFDHAEFGSLHPKASGEFPKSHAEVLKKISGGAVVDEETALQEFRDANAPKTGYDQDSETGTGVGGKAGQKTGQR